MSGAGPQRSDRARTGAQAEELARRFLEANGLRLVERNFRCRNGELDLVMLDGRELAIVEVRYRLTDRLVDPAVSVCPRKRRRIALAAAHYLQRRRQFAELPVRFDVLAITGGLDRPRYDWIRCAFTTDEVGGF